MIMKKLFYLIETRHLWKEIQQIYYLSIDFEKKY